VRAPAESLAQQLKLGSGIVEAMGRDAAALRQVKQVRGRLAALPASARKGRSAGRWRRSTPRPRRSPIGGNRGGAGARRRGSGNREPGGAQRRAGPPAVAAQRRRRSAHHAAAGRLRRAGAASRRRAGRLGRAARTRARAPQRSAAARAGGAGAADRGRGAREAGRGAGATLAIAGLGRPGRLARPDPDHPLPRSGGCPGLGRSRVDATARRPTEPGGQDLSQALHRTSTGDAGAAADAAEMAVQRPPLPRGERRSVPAVTSLVASAADRIAVAARRSLTARQPSVAPAAAAPTGAVCRARSARLPGSAVLSVPSAPTLPTVPSAPFAPSRRSVQPWLGRRHRPLATSPSSGSPARYQPRKRAWGSSPCPRSALAAPGAERRGAAPVAQDARAARVEIVQQLHALFHLREVSWKAPQAVHSAAQ